jgi:LmbE family N-acetylglucosaminyl deacetylase
MEIREGEQRAAAAVAGAKEVIFLRQHDGEVVPDLALRRTLTRIIRQYKPDWIVTNDPTAVWTRFNSINHPDHRAVGQAVLDAVYPSARDHLTFVELWRDEGLETHKVTRVYLAGTLQPNAKVDISAHFETKLAAIREHKSQVKDYEAMVQRQRTNFDVEFGEDTPTFTEVFRLLTLR